MNASMIKPNRAVKHALMALQLMPFVILMAIGLAQLVNTPTMGMLVWLRDAYGISLNAYPTFALVCALGYGGGILRLRARRHADFISLMLYGLVSAPLMTYALLYWYWATRITPGFPLVTAIVWASVAIAMLVIYWFMLVFSLWLWEHDQREKLKP